MIADWPAMEYLEELMKRKDVADAMAIVEECMGRMVADAIKISQTPAPTFDEGERADLMEELYKSLKLGNVARDDVGNVIFCLSEGAARPNIYLVAHMDTSYSREEDHTASLDGEKLSGPSVADNSVGLAALITLSRILKKTDLKLGANVYCVSTVGSHGKGYSAGIRSVVDELGENIDAVIGVEGVELGRIGHFSQGCRILDVSCKMMEGEPEQEAERPNAVRVIAEIIHKIGGLKLPSAPDAVINFGFVEGGEEYDKIPTSSRCGIEVLSMDTDSLAHVENRVRFWVNKIAAKMGAEARIESVRQHPSGSISEDHFLVELSKDVNTFLNLKPLPGGASPDISVPLSRGIPAVALAVTEGVAQRGEETAFISPMSQGIKQLLLTILALAARWDEYITLPVW